MSSRSPATDPAAAESAAMDPAATDRAATDPVEPVPPDHGPTVPDAEVLRRFRPPVGPVDGWEDGDLVRATGIRYAVADRFGRPRPAPDRTEPFAATSWSPASPQVVGPKGAELFSEPARRLVADEHAQYLSITAPADAAPTERLPVLVWIHGGSYITGAGDSSITDPGPLVREQRLVVVTVTYRLGALGYLGTDQRPANLGLLDQAEALRWVRRNIGAFGGDAQRVTAMGESAGGDAIAHLLAAFPDDPLCDRAILQSPPLGLRRNRAKLTAATAKAVEHLDADSTTEDLLAVERPVHAIALRFGLLGGMPFGVQYGHEPMPPEEDVEAGWEVAAPHVPLLIGTMGTEFSLFTRQVGLVEKIGRAAALDRRVLGPLESWGTRQVFTRGVDELAQLWADVGGEVHRYEIPWAAPGNPFRSTHGMDVVLQFGDHRVWEGAGVVAGSSWEEFAHVGEVLRAHWGAFARGEELGAGEEGILEIRRVDAA